MTYERRDSTAVEVSFDDADGVSHWKIPCVCTDSEHDVELYFERSDNGDGYELTMNMTLYYNNGLRWGSVHSLWQRVIDAGILLFTGKVHAQGNILLDQRGVNGLKEALEYGVKTAKGE